MIGKALLNLADIANCVSGDFHFMHLNFQSEEFDIFHKTILKEYYEQAASDYDLWAEAALMFDDAVQTLSPNKSAERIDWQSIEQDKISRRDAIFRTNELLDSYLAAAVIVLIALSKGDACHKCIGISNTLQTRIEYWSKEYTYFNKRRGE